ncbi:hypothetical protein KAR91_24950 [Candidatus Pacearchaeota archaeon]|nr:hypothetical protein [Candidatus Pacearchaeota archaeon]
MLTKETKIKVLENFYALDYVFFGKPVKTMESCCLGLVEDYMSVKGALMSVMIEMYKLVDHSPAALAEKVGSKELTNSAKSSAKFAREMCHKLVTSKKGRSDIKASLKEAISADKSLDVNEAVQLAIRQKAFGLACDNLLIAPTIAESGNYNKLNDWSGRIVEDSYKILRDSLVESALIILSTEG